MSGDTIDEAFDEGPCAAGVLVGCERSAVRGLSLEIISHSGSLRVGFQGMLLMVEGLATADVNSSFSLSLEAEEMEEAKLSWEVGLAVRRSDVRVVVAMTCAAGLSIEALL